MQPSQFALGGHVINRPWQKWGIFCEKQSPVAGRQRRGLMMLRTLARIGDLNWSSPRLHGVSAEIYQSPITWLKLEVCTILKRFWVRDYILKLLFKSWATVLLCSPGHVIMLSHRFFSKSDLNDRFDYSQLPGCTRNCQTAHSCQCWRSPNGAPGQENRSSHVYWPPSK